MASYDQSLVHKAFINSGLLQEGGTFAHAIILSIETGRDVAMDFLNFAFRKAAQAGFQDCEYVPDDIWDSVAQSFYWERYVA